MGDCAAMVAPLTGDGMGMGLRTAELAATMMLAGFWKELPWDQTSAEYARHWQREFLPRLRWGRCLEAILLRPRLLNYIVPDFVHVLVDGRIVKSGDKQLALELEQKGYGWIEEQVRSGQPVGS
jgi:flavin-dependent dehydrogenase